MLRNDIGKVNKVKRKIRIIAFILAALMTVSSTGCFFLSDSLGGLGDALGGSGDSGGSGSGGSGEGSEGSGGSADFPEGEDNRQPDEWQGGSEATDAIALHVVLDESISVEDVMPEGESADGLLFQSRCEDIAKVEDGAIVGTGVGRTLIWAKNGEQTVVTFSVTVEFLISESNGFDISSTKVDPEIHKVESMKEANKLIDAAIASHMSRITVDFSLIDPNFDVTKDFDLDSELGNHTKLRILYYENSMYKAEFEIVYKADTASKSIEYRSYHDYPMTTVASANALARRAAAFKDATPRVDNFDGFKINSPEIEEWEVYNSEDLWWAVEQGYRPSFPEVKTKAELFYNRAKMILREIVHDGMNDYEKVLAIYEYLIDSVQYDYDAYEKGVDRDDTCYFLEGVFETARAVCDGKSKAFVLLCGIEGIACVRDFGESRTGGAGHAWNYVRIDGDWYLVDTTDGDVRFIAGDGAAEYLVGSGHEVETVGYGLFLRPTTSLAQEYVYTDKWSEIVEAGAEISTDYFDNDIANGVDFIINSKLEAESIFSLITSGDMPELMVLVFVAPDTDSAYGYFTRVKSLYGLTMTIFTTDYEGETVCLALFKTV